MHIYIYIYIYIYTDDRLIGVVRHVARDGLVEEAAGDDREGSSHKMTNVKTNTKSNITTSIVCVFTSVADKWGRH